jgi:hypothetical protein
MLLGRDDQGIGHSILWVKLSVGVMGYILGRLYCHWGGIAVNNTSIHVELSRLNT